MDWRRISVIAGVSAAALLLLLELGVRASGALDFPLWKPDAAVGYVPAPNQSGRGWAFNDRSMGVSRPFKATPGCVVLVGGRLIYSDGGAVLEDRVAQGVARQLGRPVWPVAAEGWTLQNELAYLEAEPEALACDTIVLVSGSGDYQAPAVWDGDLAHPRKRPLLGSLYLLRKTLFAPPAPKVDWPTPAQEAQWGASLDRFLGGYHGKVIFLLFADRPDIDTYIDRFGPFLNRLHGRAEAVQMRQTWYGGDFQSDGVHALPASEPKLANLIAGAVKVRLGSSR